LNIIAAVLAFCTMPLVLGLVVRMATLSSRRGRPWVSLWGAVGAVIAVPLASAFWLNGHGTPIHGVIAGKNESLSIDDTGLNPSVLRRFTLTVADPDMQAPYRHLPMRGDLEIDIDEQHYDALREGQFVAMHEWTLGPLKVARLDDMPWWDLAPGLHGRVADAFGRSPGWGAIAVSEPATVLSVRAVHDAYPLSLLGGGSTGGEHVILKQPYDEVRLQVRTADGREVIALDRVDAGSGGTLAPGTQVAVVYPVDRPRMARLASGARRYAVRNDVDYWSSESIGFAIFCAIIGVACLLRRRLPPMRTT
jgi:hypothetical protein